MEQTTDEKAELLSKSELSIWLDGYDDIFSDFDPRPYTERALSDDFINEARKMSREKPSGKIELKLLMPSGKRMPEVEEIILKNLHVHFRHTAHAIELERKNYLKRGYIISFFGFSFLGLASWLVNLPEKSFFINSLRVVLEPSGWFMIWTGLEHIFYISRKKKPELEFNTKMAHAEITFLSF